MALQGLDADRNDVYVRQALWSYNGEAVYVGHSRGLYLYYYEPFPEDAERYEAGWCLSAYLGSGAPPFRLALPVTLARAAATGAGASLSSGPSAAGSSASMMSAGTADVLSEDELQVQWIPHAASLLQSAVASGTPCGLCIVPGAVLEWGTERGLGEGVVKPPPPLHTHHHPRPNNKFLKISRNRFFCKGKFSDLFFLYTNLWSRTPPLDPPRQPALERESMAHGGGVTDGNSEMHGPPTRPHGTRAPRPTPRRQTEVPECLPPMTAARNGLPLP